MKKALILHVLKEIPVNTSLCFVTQTGNVYTLLKVSPTLIITRHKTNAQLYNIELASLVFSGCKDILF